MSFGGRLDTLELLALLQNLSVSVASPRTAVRRDRLPAARRGPGNRDRPRRALPVRPQLRRALALGRRPCLLRLHEPAVAPAHRRRNGVP